MVRRLALFLGAVAALTAACGGGAAPTSAVATSAPPAPTAAATSTSTTASPTPAAAASPRPFAELAGAAKGATYKATFKWSGTSAGETISGDQTWYVRGAQSRFDLETKQGSIALFDLADGTYVCTGRYDDYAYRTEWTCLGTPKHVALQGNPAASLSVAVEEQLDRFSTTFEGSRTIAGQVAQCYAVRGDATAGVTEGRVCYSAAGIPLLLRSAGSGFDVTIEATAVSTTVTDEDLKLPATPVKLGAP